LFQPFITCPPVTVDAIPFDDIIGFTIPPGGTAAVLAEKVRLFPGNAMGDNWVFIIATTTAAVLAEKVRLFPGNAMGDNWVFAAILDYNKSHVIGGGFG